MKKKVLSVVMAAAMMTSVFSATAVTASAADAEELTIWVHETDSPEGQLYKTLIDEFNKEYEGTYHATLTQMQEAVTQVDMMIKLMQRLQTADFRMYSQ